MSRWRRPMFGRRSPYVVAGFCAWELAALLPGARIPTFTSLIRRYPAGGVALLALLAHHFFVETAE